MKRALPKQPFKRPAEAFTLIELLVVIAILGILAALLLPALSSAKSRSVQVIDIGNLKQFMAATELYVADNHEVLPPPNWLSADHSGNPGWLYTLDDSASGPDAFQLQKGLFWLTLLSQKLYLCPMDNTNSPLFRQRDQQLSSYAMNGAVIGYNRTNFPPAKLGSLKPDDVAFWETDEMNPGYFNDGANLPSEGVSRRHNQGDQCRLWRRGELHPIGGRVCASV